MEERFWHQRWETNNIGFHSSQAHPLLVQHVELLDLKKGEHIFIPLCGKTLDIAFFLSRGVKVTGVELSETAIEQLFDELGTTPKVQKIDGFTHYRSENIDIYVGNIFDLDQEILGSIQAVYDRAALVALPEDMRYRYTEHLIQVTNSAPQLLICFEYDQDIMDGPPFSVSDKEVVEHYQSNYDIHLIESREVKGGLKGFCLAQEKIWFLNRVKV